ncbi:CPBP family intramembrane glutamic endopeptidase [uncultured Flavonifractor sp.]|uniref:CPBP family intramembrane glutamic endopeptidase n=1 Tax=uncultured Flavonifractor sp. TaxID=1193534 RepID=UPI00174E7735|nr:CPBP family intramembrane glutamic endopeptidase [uncultured Flavonifractor sp.]
MERSERAERALRLRGHRERFSRLGWALVAQMAAMLAVQTALLLAAQALAPVLVRSGVFLWLVSVLSAYGAGVPAAWLVLRGTEEAPPQPGAPLGPGRFFRSYLAGLGLMYLVNLATLALMGLVGLLRGQTVENPVDNMADYPLVLNLLLGCVIAPVCEEYLFRGLLLNRLRPYGERFAVWASALCFGLFHGNFSQFFYACAIGVLFAGVVLKTGRLRQAMLLHALINFVGTGLIPLLSGLGEAGDWLLTLLVLAAMFVGLAFLPAMRREFSPAPGWKGLTAGEAWRCFLANPGMLCFLALFLLLAGSYLV